MKYLSGYGILHDGDLIFDTVKLLKKDTMIAFQRRNPSLNIDEYQGYPTRTLEKHNCSLVKVSITVEKWEKKLQ